MKPLFFVLAGGNDLSIYNVQSRKNGEMRVGVVGNVSAASSTKTAEAAVKGMSGIAFETTQRGALVFDEATGRTKRGETKSFTTTRIDAAVNGKPDPQNRTTIYNAATVRFINT